MTVDYDVVRTIEPGDHAMQYRVRCLEPGCFMHAAPLAKFYRGTADAHAEYHASAFQHRVQIEVAR